MEDNLKKENFELDFIGIGAGKSATTWIYRCLQEHPGIYLLPKDNKKSNYFLNSEKSKEEEKEYRYFLNIAEPGQVVGEFNNFYMRKGEKVAERIRRHNPKVKLLACLRNPVDRAYSAYTHHYTLTGKEEKSLKSVANELRETIIKPGFYYKNLKKFFDRFPRENILILIYDDIEKDPIKFIQEIYDFLGVDSSFIPEKSQTKIASGKFKKTKLGQLIHRKVTPFLKKSKLGWKINESPLVAKWFYRFADFYTKGKSSDYSIKKEDIEYLKGVYERDIEKLENLINRDLSIWKVK